MNNSGSASSSEMYENLSVEVYYADNIDNGLRESLQKELQDRYLEKYSPSIPGCEPVPVLNIEMGNNSRLLIGDEISVEAINQVLKR